jgi:hypothetical protein
MRMHRLIRSCVVQRIRGLMFHRGLFWKGPMRSMISCRPNFPMEHRRPPTVPKLQSVQTRTFQNIKTGQEKRVRLKMCHSEEDLYRDFPMFPDYTEEDIESLAGSDDEQAMYVRCNFKMKAIHKEVIEVYGTAKNLEIYDFTRSKWLPFVSLTEWSEYSGSAEPMYLRIPKLYDDTPVDEKYSSPSRSIDPRSIKPSSNAMPGQTDEEEKDIYDILKSTRPLILADTIRGLVRKLKMAGYKRSSTVTAQTMRNARGEVVTREWILQQGERNRHVAAVLLGHIGALDHIVECLHYNCVWIDRNEKRGADMVKVGEATKHE